MDVTILKAIVLDSRTNKTIHDVDSAPIRLNIPAFTIQKNDPYIGTYYDDYPLMAKRYWICPYSLELVILLSSFLFLEKYFSIPATTASE